MINIAIIGAAGRMGQALISCAGESADLQVAAGVVGPSTADIGIPTFAKASQIPDGIDVVVDFSTANGFDAALAAAVERGVAFVSGSTGLSPEQRNNLKQAARVVPTLWAANFSIGVNVLEHLVETATRATSGFDIEVFESHHRNKVDAPSGTALLLGEAAARGRGLDLGESATWTRHGHTGPRTDSEIGFQVVRGGSVVGEHTVYLLGDGERIELSHRAEDRTIFARGALRAAEWICGKEPAQYSMRDVLFG